MRSKFLNVKLRGQRIYRLQISLRKARAKNWPVGDQIWDGLSLGLLLLATGVVAGRPGGSSAIMTILLAESLDEPVSSVVWLVKTVWLSRADVVYIGWLIPVRFHRDCRGKGNGGNDTKKKKLI